MSFPQEWADRIFARLSAAYGAEFDRLYAGRDLRDVKAAWCDVLQGWEARPDAIRWAIDHLPEDKAPHAVAFRALLRQAPDAHKPLALPPPAQAGVVEAVIAKATASAKASAAARGTPAQAVLQGIVDRLEREGRRPSQAQLGFAQACVRMLRDADPLRAKLASLGFDGVIGEGATA